MDFKQLNKDVDEFIEAGVPKEVIDGYIKQNGFTIPEFKLANENYGTFMSAVKRGGKNIGSLIGDFLPAMGADLLEKIAACEGERMETIKTRISNNLAEVVPPDKTDKNRFEQELIYFLEKIDITEEKLRLKTHCDYFITTMKEDSAGRKLGFISQEIGREVNTIGSKANHAEIQRLVVQMKDELEKIKEQLLNIL